MWNVLDCHMDRKEAKKLSAKQVQGVFGRRDRCKSNVEYAVLQSSADVHYVRARARKGNKKRLFCCDVFRTGAVFAGYDSCINCAKRALDFRGLSEII